MKKGELLRNWGVMSLTWSLIILFPVGRSWWTELLSQEYLFYLSFWLFGLSIFPLQQRWLYKDVSTANRWWKILILQVGMALLVAALYQSWAGQFVVTKSVVIDGAQWEGIQQGKVRFIPGDAFTSFYLYMIHAATGLLWAYQVELRHRERMEAGLKLNLVYSKLKALQSELQPHFIFNTLHAASSLMEEDTAKAQLLLENFSYLLRRYVTVISHQFYTLEEEFEFLEEYINVYRIRSIAPIELKVNVSSISEPVLVPVIFLQPVVENAIKHGWYNRNEHFQISIQVSISGDMCQVEVANKLQVSSTSMREGIGLRNLRDRLSVLYGTKFTFWYGEENGLFINRIGIPNCTDRHT